MKQLLFSLLAALAAAMASPETSRCTYAHSWFPMRGALNDFYLARATADSAFVRDLYWGAGGLFTTPQHQHHQKIAMYGQIAEVVRLGNDAAPQTIVGEKVVLIWLSYGAGCEILPSRRALVAAPGTELFVNLSALPRPAWIDGLKSYDVEGQWRGTSSLYAPEFVSLGPRAQADRAHAELMTSAEFMAMYQILMPSGSPTTQALQEFLLWAQDNPELARKYPACAMVYTSEINLRRGEPRERVRCP